MSLFDRIKDRFGGEPRIHIGDPRFDEWEMVRDFEDLETALAWRDRLREAGQTAVLTSDWELDRFRRGEIMLQVPPGNWSEAEELLSNLDLD
ncbi:MAG: hypothetical protein M9938_09435 [Solirubrobacterales bacterium]|nr:hypothetical protein [Solirubrobacterales bacterium]